MRALRRALFASGALFAALLVLLGAQLALGRDPALRAQAPQAVAGVSARGDGEAKPIWRAAVESALGALLDDEDGAGEAADERGRQAPAVRSATS